MKGALSIGRHRRKRDLSWALGVSEAVGTVLLLGISVFMAGMVALWTTQIDEGQEGTYVDLWASVQDNKVVILHRGGDFLDGANTKVVVRDEIGTEVTEVYYDTTKGRTDETWGPGEEISVDITTFSQSLEVVVVTLMENGEPIVILNSQLLKNPSLSDLPDLAITQVQVITKDKVPVTTIYETGYYHISVRVTNLGSNLTEDYFAPEVATQTLTNLRIFDTDTKLTFVDLQVYDGTGTLIPTDLPPRLKYGESFNAHFNWSATYLNQRSLGLHILNVKVVPHPQGEVNYRNNYVERNFKVDKELIPIIINGPDPGVYDVYFSNDAPKSGEMVTVTVIVQNSGDEEITPDMGVNLIVSTWRPDRSKTPQAHNWKMDYDGHYGAWRLGNESVQLVEDNTFPTCVIMDLALLPGAYMFLYFTLEARVDIPGGEQWVYAAIDIYNTSNEPNGALSISDGDDPGDNMDLGRIQVLPKILVVDDDEHPSGTVGDMTSFVVESLVGAGVNVDKFFIAQQVDYLEKLYDTPAFDYDTEGIPAPAMEDYDVVIWVTGGVEDPFTNVRPSLTHNGGNVQHLMRYMNANKYLLIVGTSPFTDLANLFTGGQTQNPKDPSDLPSLDASDLLYDYLGINIIKIDQDLPLDETLHGLDTEKITPMSGVDEYTIDLWEQSGLNQGMQLYQLRTSEETEGTRIFQRPIPVITSADQLPYDQTKYVNSLRANSKPHAETLAQYRSVVLGWNITQIKYLNEKIDLFANIMSWFDWNINVGRDLAVTKMDLSIITEQTNGNWIRVPINDTYVPKYLDTIEIEVTIRNNGPSIESSSIIFYLTGPEGVEVPIPPKIPNPETGARETNDNPADIGSIDGRGSERTFFKLWLAVGVGSYSFRVVVDPYHLITEVNEENNDITYSTSTISSFVTQNNILIVDDDFSDDNFDDSVPPEKKAAMVISYSSPDEEPSDVIDKALDTFGYDHETETVLNKYIMGTGWYFQSDLSILDLKRYNAVIWVFGGSGNSPLPQRETLTDEDIFSIKDYLDGNYPESQYLTNTHHENIMFVGSEFVGELAFANDEIEDFDEEGGMVRTIKLYDFIEDYLGIRPVIPAGGSSTEVHGPTDGNILTDIHLGLDYSGTNLMLPIDYSPIQLNTVVAPSGTTYRSVTALKTSSSGVETVIANQFNYTAPRPVVSEGKTLINFRAVVHSWELTHLAHGSVETALNELLYITLHWFATPEDSPELVGRDCMVILDTDHPVIGNAYLVQAKIANLGGKAGGGTIRFNDGNTLIKSENVYLNPNSVATLEALWRPVYAGNRVISVQIDRYDDTDEVFDVINNIPVANTYVYFFWDDMESGDGNWEHDSTILLLNGEGALDYMRETTDTNIAYKWETMDGFQRNLDVTNENMEKEYHSSDVSFFMHEPSGTTTRTADIVFAIDSSDAMSDNSVPSSDPNDLRKSATRNFIDTLYDEYRVGVIDFDGIVTTRYSLGLDRTAAKSSIGLIDGTGNRALYDAGYQGLSTLDTIGKDDADAVKALIIVAGGPNIASLQTIDSYKTYRDSLDNVPTTEDNVLVFTINLLYGDEIELKSMCTQPWASGPYYYRAADPTELVTIYDNILKTLKTSSSTSSRGSVDGSRTRGFTMFQDSFPASTLDTGKWQTSTTTIQNKAPYSSSYAVEFEGTDSLTSNTIDTSSQTQAYISFWWRAGYWGGPTGSLETGDYIWLDLYVKSGLGGIWLSKYYLVNDDSGYTDWNHGTLQLPPEAFWTGFQFRFVVAMQSGSANDAFYLDDVRVDMGILGPGSVISLDLNPWSDGTFGARNKYIQTPPIDLSNIDGATLSFYQKYNMKKGSNGGVVLVGVEQSGGSYEYSYLQPEQPYTGDLPSEPTDPKFTDDEGTWIRWVWNGISGGGTLGWDYTSFDLTSFKDQRIIVRFSYLYVEGGTGYGWIIDDVKVTVSSNDDNPNKGLTSDIWRLREASTKAEAHSGDHAWFCGDDSAFNGNKGDLKDSLDNSLFSRPIDLTNARTATLEAYFKFNLDQDPGRPPDGFRVEVSIDNGIVWTPINLGVRASWKVSGSEVDADDGIPSDGKSFTGIEDDPGNSFNWVPASSLARLITDLGAFTGNVIILRFRVITDLNTEHYEDENQPFGFYVDDVFIFGESLAGTRSTEDDSAGVSIPLSPESVLAEKEMAQRYWDQDTTPSQDNEEGGDGTINNVHTALPADPLAKTPSGSDQASSIETPGQSPLMAASAVISAVLLLALLTVALRRRDRSIRASKGERRC